MPAARLLKLSGRRCRFPWGTTIMRRVSFILLFCLLLIPASAFADIIQYQGLQVQGLKVSGNIGHKKVKVDYLGQIDITWDEKEALAAYCADILSYGIGGEYDVQSLSSFDYDTYSNLYQAAWIMENYSLLSTVEEEYSSRELVTAVQSSIWTLMSNWDLTKVYGSRWQQVYVTSLYSEMLSLAADVDFSTYTFQHNFYFAISQEGKQDILFATEGGGAAVPEPGSLLLMGTALTGVWGMLRRRRRRSAQSHGALLG